MVFTGEEIDKAVEAWDKSEEYGSSLDHFANELEYPDEGEQEDGVELPGIGKCLFVEQFGGEGQGDDYWLVFRIGDDYYRINGWYASYNGGEYTGIESVTPSQKTITVYS